MPARRILYVPWDLKQARSSFGMAFSGTPGFEFAAKNNKWIEACEAKQIPDNERKDIYQVWYSLNEQRAVVPSPLLADLGQEDQVYIRGHCSPGRLYLSTDEPVSQETSDRRYGKGLIQDQKCLQVADVAARLQASGLHPSFRGKIKCYNCNSAAPTTGPNFTLAFSAEMRASGFVHCQVFGYFGTLDSFHDADHYNKSGKGDGHKHAYNGDNVDLGRASANRYVVDLFQNQVPRLMKA